MTGRSSRMFDDDTVRHIRQRFAEGHSINGIATLLQCNSGVIHQIVKRKTYKDVKDVSIHQPGSI